MNRRALIVTLGLVAGCAHDPRRPVRAETISLETVNLRVPDEPGWTAFDATGFRDRTLRLQHVDSAGAVDRTFRIEERGRVPATQWTPESYLSQVEQSGPVREDDLGWSRTGAEPFQPDERFSPIGVRRSIRNAAPTRQMKVGAGTVVQVAFVPAESDRSVGLSEYSADGTTPILDALQLAPRSPDRTTAVPDLEWVLELTSSLGVGLLHVQGKDVEGEAARLALGTSTRLPRSLLGIGLAIDAGFAAFTGDEAKNAKPNALVVDLNASVIIRRLRLGAGVALDYVFAGSREVDPIRDVVKVGPRLFASLDVATVPGAACYLGVESAFQGDYQRLGFVAGGRFGSYEGGRTAVRSPPTPRPASP